MTNTFSASVKSNTSLVRGQITLPSLASAIAVNACNTHQINFSLIVLSLLMQKKLNSLKRVVRMTVTIFHQPTANITYSNYYYYYYYTRLMAFFLGQPG